MFGFVGIYAKIIIQILFKREEIMKTVKKFICVLFMCMFAFSFVPVINAGSEVYTNTKECICIC